MPSLTTLPPELLLELLAHLLPSPYSLLQCALVCRALHPCARAVFFRDIQLVETTSSADKTHELAELLDSSHDLGSYIRTLRFKFDWLSPPGPPFVVASQDLHITYTHELQYYDDPTRYPDVVGALPFSQLSELRELVLGEGIMLSEPADQVVTILKMLPRLERLGLRRVRAGHPRKAGTSSDPIDFTEPARALVLKDLELDHVFYFPVCEVAHRLLQQFRGCLALEALVVRCRSWDGLFNHHTAWIPFLTAVTGSLRRLYISTGELDHGDRPPDGAGGAYGNSALHTNLLDVLRGCKCLRTLRLEYLLPSYLEPQASVPLHRSDFLRSLCVLFEDRPAFADYLEELSLHMVDWYEIMVSVDRTLGDRLARVLLDSSRYPRFKSLEVQVRIEDDMFSDDEVPALEKEDDLAIEARWREAFSGFAKATAGFVFRLEIERDLSLY
ncbi:hypothetical protein K466DRAFT_200179 [Polyporus arcularius HHB13444]|uniref:F-box domain-containing protein n=1 Tax=Polyporus arcularius HHB13444 TaxID=1314778 RepID=A0A5C3P643_9APHY|nr:hypothetical protein K466DRAFT_200179 [Polyporus arcularius HHB13444]